MHITISNNKITKLLSNKKWMLFRIVKQFNVKAFKIITVLAYTLYTIIFLQILTNQIK